MIGYNLITHQTTAQGLLVKTVLVHEGVDIDRQIYLAILHDRKNQGLCIVSSKKGGMDIEEVAKVYIFQDLLFTVLMYSQILLLLKCIL